AGAEILVDRVRKLVSPNKCTADQWIEVMRIAHRMGMLTSATMMFGHLETIEERIEHLLRIREVQAQKPESSPGFKAFIPWPFQKNGTVLEQEYSQIKKVIPSEYLRLLSISRLALVNIQNIQASWLTVGREVGQVALYAGANDLGSIMIEENVVSSTGTRFTMTKEQMIQTIVEAGFEPLQRNQDYTIYDQ
ncbi:MAG TPA: dehypoxanthine futalosine cyclase, partial [Salinivirgaceae bacterium]|nr:dehypoxanthine futalosine cyclase [Salinivirgaceae bacterium]